MKVIECKELSKRHEGRHALRNLSFVIKDKSITGLIGRNGAGKTTLMKMIAGYWRGTEGELKVFGQQPFNNLFVSANSIYVDDQMEFPNAFTLTDILREAERFYEKWDKELASRLFHYFEFHPKQRHHHLSKGKKSTFNMIIGIASRCELTMFDEPTTGMDASVRKDFYRALLKDYLAYPRTVLISSHHLEEVEDLLEDVLLIDRGSKYFHLSIDEVKSYAVGITGKTEAVDSWIKGKEVIHTAQIGKDTSYAVVRNAFIPLEKAEQTGLKVTPVAANDLCVYLTTGGKGGIDDVFNNNEQGAGNL